MCPGPHQNKGRSWRRETGLSPPVNYFTDCSKAVLLLWIICVFVSCVSHAFASVHCCLVVTCWERADLLALILYFCYFPMWYPGSGVYFLGFSEKGYFLGYEDFVDTFLGSSQN